MNRSSELGKEQRQGLLGAYIDSQSFLDAFFSYPEVASLYGFEIICEVAGCVRWLSFLSSVHA